MWMNVNEEENEVEIALRRRTGQRLDEGDMPLLRGLRGRGNVRIVLS